jgi:hypothetical protein
LKRVLLVAVLGAVELIGCLVRNPAACKTQVDCPSGQLCNLTTFRCYEPMVPDGGADLSAAVDMAQSDGALHDLANADLTRECANTGQCTDPSKPVCAVGLCRACQMGDDSQCAMHSGEHFCDSDGGRCVECNGDSACPSPKPVCGSDGSCRICKLNKECASGVCKDSGTCATSAEIYYVDNGDQPVATCKMILDLGGTRDGSSTRPFCDIQDAVNQGGRLYIKVAGHLDFSYGEVAVTTGTVIIVGPGADVPDPPTVADPAIIIPTMTANPAVKLAVSAGNASLTVIGVEAGSRSFAISQDAFNCDNLGGGLVTLTIKKSVAQRSSNRGVFTLGCRVSIDSMRIGFNVGGGVNLNSGTQYNVLNSFIYRNSSTAVYIDPTATGTFQFNTVANNMKGSGGAGIDCGSGMPLIESSIFHNNTLTETFGNCIFANTDIDMTNPMFVNEAMDDYRIGNPSLANRVSGTVDGGGPLPDHDFFGTHRPLNGAWDVGAHELQ